MITNQEEVDSRLIPNAMHALQDDTYSQVVIKAISCHLVDPYFSFMLSVRAELLFFVEESLIHDNRRTRIIRVVGMRAVMYNWSLRHIQEQLKKFYLKSMEMITVKYNVEMN